MIKTYPEYRHTFTNCEDIHNYIHGGRGIVTLEAPSGNSHTYCFFRPRDPSQFPDDVIFVYALHEGTKQFYIGMVELDKFRLTRNSRFLNDTDIVRGARYIMRMSNEQELLRTTPMKLCHEGLCCRCGRALTADNSLETGIGPKCTRIIFGTQAKKSKLHNKKLIDENITGSADEQSTL